MHLPRQGTEDVRGAHLRLPDECTTPERIATGDVHNDLANGAGWVRNLTIAESGGVRIAEDAPNSDIARRLFPSDKTVRNYLSSIFTKLDVAGRPEAIVRVREAGLGR